MMKAKRIYTRTTLHSVQRFYRLDRPLILSNLRAVSELMVSSLCLSTETSVHLYPVHDEGIAWEPLAMVVGLSAELGRTEALDAMLLEMLNIEKREPTRQTVYELETTNAKTKTDSVLSEAHTEQCDGISQCDYTS